MHVMFSLKQEQPLMALLGFLLAEVAITHTHAALQLNHAIPYLDLLYPRWWVTLM